MDKIGYLVGQIIGLLLIICGLLGLIALIKWLLEVLL